MPLNLALSLDERLEGRLRLRLLNVLFVHKLNMLPRELYECESMVSRFLDTLEGANVAVSPSFQFLCEAKRLLALASY